MAIKKQTKRPPQITIFFPSNQKLQKQIVADAQKIGISVSSLGKIALEMSYPHVREKLKEIADLPK